MARIVLASASPRRADLLRSAGFSFEVLAVDVDERVREGELPRDLVRRLAADKSAAAAKTARARGLALAELLILGADTAVVVEGVILGKPLDDTEAAAMLNRLSGR